MRALLLAALLVPASALAGAPSPGTVVVSGVVDVPLLAGAAADDAGSYVRATVGEKTLTLRVATGHGELRLTEGAAKKIGAKVKGKDDDKTAALDAGFKLGDATVSDVTAVVTDVKGADGEIGLAGFGGVVWGVLPSKGVLRIARTAAEIGVSGAAVSFESVPEAKRAIGEGEKVEFPAIPVVAKVAWSGVEVPTRIALEAKDSLVAREVDGVNWYKVEGAPFVATPLPAAPGREIGEARTEWRGVKVGGVDGWSAVRRPGVGMRSAFDVNARLGADVLSGYDLVLDPSARTVTFATAANARVDGAADKEKELRDALTPKGDAPDEKAKSDARKGGIPALAGFLASHGKRAEAIALRTELTTLAADDCTAWLNLGEDQLVAGAVADAGKSFAKAGELYAPWAALSLADRKAAQEGKAKAEKKGETWAGAKAQDHACHVAFGKQALALAVGGDAAGVAALYPAKLDLDVNLALAAGHAGLVKGDVTAAEAAYRQAIHMAKTYEPVMARNGLFLALEARAPQLAQDQLARTRFAGESGTDVRAVSAWVASVQGTAGVAAAQTALDTLAKDMPWDAAVLVARARFLSDKGDGGAAAAWKDANARIDARLALTPRDASVLALRAWAQLGAGQVQEAAATAEKATQLDDGKGAAWLALADVRTAAGDYPGANAALARARAADADNALYVRLAERIAPPPPPPPVVEVAPVPEPEATPAEKKGKGKKGKDGKSKGKK